MHEAYQKTGIIKSGFGVFFYGLSKTDYIEQSFVQFEKSRSLSVVRDVLRVCLFNSPSYPSLREERDDCFRQ